MKIVTIGEAHRIGLSGVARISEDQGIVAVQRSGDIVAYMLPATAVGIKHLRTAMQTSEIKHDPVLQEIIKAICLS